VIDGRVVWLSALAVAIGGVAAVIARLLTALIGLVTNVAFFGRVSTTFVSPADNHRGWWVLLIPTIGGVIVGLMARYGSRAIRGHGIPEAMEQILTNESRIPPRITWLKPLSAAIAIGTGGPFGAEGPIIATGGAVGSVVGQLLHINASERKTLLAAGAAAGMAATFGTPIAAVLLAVELLLFEYRPRSLAPVAFASATAAAVRCALVGSDAVFPIAGRGAMPASSGALLFYGLLGVLVGLIAVVVTRLVYAVEDGFEHLPIHWMWWPALGGLVVGAAGIIAPHTLGVGYDNIDGIVSGTLVGRALLVLVVVKFVSWCVALGSGTSGGTLAPLFTIGGGIGALLGGVAAAAMPSLGIDPRIAGLVGMAALFGGASRAFLASVVFAFETTREPAAILPLLAGCAAAFVVSGLLMETTIMTEKIVRRGVRVPADYEADPLVQIPVRGAASAPVVTLQADMPLERARAFLASGVPGSAHQGFPILNADRRLVGVLTRRDLLGAADRTAGTPIGDLLAQPAITIPEGATLRDAADRMARAGIGRLPVVADDAPTRVVAILTRGDLLDAYAARLKQADRTARHISLRALYARRHERSGAAADIPAPSFATAATLTGDQASNR
jgi:H+/Cl- antiporter ClcA